MSKRCPDYDCVTTAKPGEVFRFTGGRGYYYFVNPDVESDHEYLGPFHSEDIARSGLRWLRREKRERRRAAHRINTGSGLIGYVNPLPTVRLYGRT